MSFLDTKIFREIDWQRCKCKFGSQPSLLSLSKPRFFSSTDLDTPNAWVFFSVGSLAFGLSPKLYFYVKTLALLGPNFHKLALRSTTELLASSKGKYFVKTMTQRPRILHRNFMKSDRSTFFVKPSC